MIRPATMDDIEVILDMIKEDCEEMGYPYNFSHMKEQMLSFISLECPVFINEHKGQPVGVIAAIVAPNLFDPAILEVREFIWHASKSLARIGRARVMVELLDYIIDLAKKAKINLHASLPVDEKTESLKDLLIRRGLKLTEYYFRLEF
jgi:hypothetical protein